jgi:hypothetical protein
MDINGVDFDDATSGVVFKLEGSRVWHVQEAVMSAKNKRFDETMSHNTMLIYTIDPLPW